MFYPIRATASSRRIPVFTIGLMLANLLVYWHQYNLRLWEERPFVYRYAAIPAHFHSPGPIVLLTLISSMFIHGSWSHVIGNVWMLWIFGGDVEGRLGRFRFLTFYFVSGLVAMGTQVASDPASNIPCLGASGAIAGVMGAYLWLYPTATVTTVFWPLFPIPYPKPKFFEWPAAFWLGVWIFDQVAASMSGAGGIAWFAHIGGFGGGFVLALIMG